VRNAKLSPRGRGGEQRTLDNLRIGSKGGKRYFSITSFQLTRGENKRTKENDNGKNEKTYPEWEVITITKKWVKKGVNQLEMKENSRKKACPGKGEKNGKKKMEPFEQLVER